MKSYRPLKVICYSGAKKDESPRAIVVSGVRYEVEEIIDRWLEEDRASRERRSYFILKLQGRSETVRIFHLEDRQWFLVEPS